MVMKEWMTHTIYMIYSEIYGLFFLRCVLPIFYSGSLTDSASVLSDYAFLYKYDTRNRCIGKKQPGCEWVELVYDRCDRLIFTQNGKERAIMNGLSFGRFVRAVCVDRCLPRYA